MQRDLFLSTPHEQVTAPDLGLRDYQQAAREGVARVHARSRGALVVLPTGCHALGQSIMRHDGNIVRVEDVSVGDQLMGMDGTPRTVLSLVSGRGEMARIVPVKGEPWSVNLDHILTLVRTAEKSGPGGWLVDVSVRDWLAWPKYRKHVHKLLRVAVDFPERPAPTISPYVLGALIGDGCLRRTVELCTPDAEIWPECQAEAERHGLTWTRRNGCKVPTFCMSSRGGPNHNQMTSKLAAYGLRVNSEHKHIPPDYKLGSRHVRLEVMAGLMDTDGHATNGGYDYISASETLASDVAFVARSLGLAAYVKPKRACDQHGTWGDYWRVSISGDCGIIPCRVERKRHAARRQVKDVLRTGFRVELMPEDDYCGFVLDGDHRYLLGDYTVTHNCGKTRTFGSIAWDHKMRGSKVLVLCPTIVLCRQMYEDMRKLGLSVAIEQASNFAVRPLPDVTVASVATMRGDRLRTFAPDAFGLVCADECFPAGTLVDGRPIETIAVGDYVDCVDHATGLVSARRVMYVFRNTTKSIVRLRIGETAVSCTTNHPIFVRGRGYVNAGNIREGDVCCVRVGDGRVVEKDVLCRLQIQACVGEYSGKSLGEATKGSEASAYSYVHLQRMRDIVSAHWEAQTQGVLGRVQSQDLCGEFGGHQSEARFTAHAGAKPNAPWRQFGAHEGHSRAHGAQADGARRERAWSNGGGESASRGTRGRVAHRTCGDHGNETGERLPAALQAGLSQPFDNGGHRSGWAEPPRTIEEESGPEEGAILVWARVDHVARDEQASAAGVAVYNLEIEGAHTYFANGVLVHNCHRSQSGSYRAIFDHFASAKLLGLTATPDRADGVSLKNTFDEVAYEMSMLAAIEQKWLVPLKFVTAQTNFDASAIRTVAGEVDAGSVADELVRSGALHEAAVALSELSGGSRAVAFCPTVASSQALVTELNARHERSAGVTQYAIHIDAGTPEMMRNSVFDAFKAGDCRVLSNVGILCEGWDAPHASVIALLSPTKSRARLAQMIGRGTRLHEGKESTLVIDFCPGRLKKGRLASPADALAGEMLPDDVHAQLPGSGDIAEAIAQARAKAAELEELRLKREERAKSKAARRDQRKDLVRPHRVVYGLEQHDMASIFGRGDIIARLEQRGVDVPKAEQSRRAIGLCSLKQANLLAKFGMKPDLSYRVAGDAISKLKANGWKVSDAMRSDRRFW